MQYYYDDIAVGTTQHVVHHPFGDMSGHLVPNQCDYGGIQQGDQVQQCITR